MKPSVFFETIILPTLEDFLSDHRSYRKALLAALVMYHLPEHVFSARFANDPDAEAHLARYRDGLSTQRWHVVLEQLANSAKHGRRRYTGYTLAQSWYAPPAIASEIECGVSFLGDTEGGVVASLTSGNGPMINVKEALTAALGHFRNDFPELYA